MTEGEKQDRAEARGAFLTYLWIGGVLAAWGVATVLQGHPIGGLVIFSIGGYLLHIAKLAHTPAIVAAISAEREAERQRAALKREHASEVERPTPQRRV